MLQHTGAEASFAVNGIGCCALLRFFLLFLAFQALLFTFELTPWGQAWVVQPFTVLLADISGTLIALTGRDISTHGVVIYDQGAAFAVEIAAGCNGVEAMILLIAGVLAFRSPWYYKGIGLLAGILGIQLLNLVRIISLFFLGMWNETAFEWAHLYVWQALIMLDALLIWLVWIYKMPRKEVPGETVAD